MNAIGAGGQSHVRAGVDEESSSSSVARSWFLRAAEGFDRLLRQPLQFARGKIFFAKLDVVHATAGGVGDLIEQLAATHRLVPGKRGAVSDVVEHGAAG